MALYKESLINTIEADLTGRNENWGVLEAHLEELAGKHITESGSNENGRYIKFDDGTMICTNYTTNYIVDQMYPGNDGGIPTQRGGGVFTFAHAFVSPPAVTFSGRPYKGTDAFFNYSQRIYGVTNTTVSIQIVAYAAFESIYNFSIIAIGRWK